MLKKGCIWGILVSRKRNTYSMQIRWSWNSDWCLSKPSPGKGVMSQCCLLVINVLFSSKEVKRKKKVPELKEMLADKVDINCDGNEDWIALKRKLLDLVCDYTKCKSRHSEIWWWNMGVDLTVCSLSFETTVKKRKTKRNTVKQRKMLRELFQW